MEGAVEQARRAKCGAHQRHVALLATQYTNENDGYYFITNQRRKPFYLAPKSVQNSTTWNQPEDKNVDWIAAIAGVGLLDSRADAT
jgi:hypothetical protein